MLLPRGHDVVVSVGPSYSGRESFDSLEDERGYLQARLELKQASPPEVNTVQRERTGKNRCHGCDGSFADRKVRSRPSARIMTDTNSWDTIENVFYRKDDVYSMLWKISDLSDYLIAGAKCGGPVGGSHKRTSLTCSYDA